MTERRLLRVPVGDDASWPSLQEADRLNWQLRYGGPPSRQDALGAAAYCDAYAELVRCTAQWRREVVRAVRAAESNPVPSGFSKSDG